MYIHPAKSSITFFFRALRKITKLDLFNANEMRSYFEKGFCLKNLKE